jgi:chromosome segregation ATPase
VLQERTDLQRYAVTSYDSGTLLAYFKDGKVSQRAVDAVKKAADMQAAINGTQTRIAQLDAEKQSIDQDQGRIRQNMGSVSRDTELYKRYMTKLNEQETRLETIREQRAKEQDTLNRQQAELQGYVAGLSVD